MTVKVTTSAVITAGALQTGECVTAIGPKDSAGTVAARALTITPPTATGCTAGFGRGGFGGGGFGGSRWWLRRRRWHNERLALRTECAYS